MRARARRLFLAAGSGLLLACACGAPASLDRAVLARQDDAYVRAVLALGVRDPDSLDFYAGPAVWMQSARSAFVPLGDVRTLASSLAAEIAGTRSRSPWTSSRRTFLHAQLAAVIGRIDVLNGRRLPFDEESRLLFGADAGGRDHATFAGIRSELDRLLPGGGSLAARYGALERRFVVPPDRLPVVLARAIEECRHVTAAHLTLPPDERVSVEYVRGMPWSAFTKYEGQRHSRTAVNLDFAFTIDRLLDVACHETYPGHHAINVLLEPRVQPLFSPESLRTEGAASYAPALAFSAGQRLALERDVLMPMAGIDVGQAAVYLRASALVDRLGWLQADIARRYLDGRLEFVRAAAALEDEALMPPEAAGSMLKFFNEFRTYVVTYTVGRDLVRDRVEAEPEAEARWRAYRRWIGT